MAYLWRGIKTRIRRTRCAMYVGTCSLCEAWKREQMAKRRAKRARALRP